MWTTTPGLDELLLVAGRPLLKSRQKTPDNPTGGDTQDQMASVFVRWVLAESGLELYGEWAKGDHNEELYDLMVSPEHGSGYLVGLQKIASHTSERTWRIKMEMLLLGAPRSTFTEFNAFFYAHDLVRQGYTNRGQILGAGIGPGSSQQSVAVERFSRWGKAGVTLFRTKYDDDRFYRRAGIRDGAHEVEPSISADAMVFRGPWDFTASLAYSDLFNQHYIEGNARKNLNISLGIRYHPLASR
jgi:hypothetical protein